MGKGQNYWQKRFEAVEAMNNQTAKETVRSITPAFDKAQAQIEKELDAWYTRFAKNNEISLQEAKKLLNTTELKEFRWDVEEYIKYGRQNAIDQQWMKQLENASSRFHISRLEALKIRTQNAAEVAFGNELDQIDQMAPRVYMDDYYHTAYEIQRGLGIGWDVSQVDQRRLNNILSKPWTADKMTFSDRIWKSKTQLIDTLHTELTQMCILGKPPDQIIKNISHKLNVSKGQAGRLVMTEAAYFGSAAQKDCFNELDVEKYEIVATLDNRTSDVCQNMDGKVFNMADFQPGVTAPPFHVWCRSCTAPWFEDDTDGMRAARDENGKTYYVPSNMKYPDWKEYFVDKTKDPADWLKPVVNVDDLKKLLAGKEAELGDVITQRIKKTNEQREFLEGMESQTNQTFMRMSDEDFQKTLADWRKRDADLEARSKEINKDYERYFERPDRGTTERDEWNKWHDEVKAKYNIESAANLGGKLTDIAVEQVNIRKKIRSAEKYSAFKTKFGGRTKQDYIDELEELAKKKEVLQKEIDELNRQINVAVYDATDIQHIKNEIIKKHETIIKTDVQKQEFAEIISGMTKEQANLYNKMSVNFGNNHYYKKKTGYYSPSGHVIRMDLDEVNWEQAVKRANQGAWKTKFHEELHQMDHVLGWFQKSPFAQNINNPTKFMTDMTSINSVAGSKMIQAIDEDVLNFINHAIDVKNKLDGLNIKPVKSLNRISTEGKEAFFELMKMKFPERKDRAMISAFTDAVGLTTKGNLHPYSQGYWGHDKSYSKSRGKDGATSEVWAELGASLLRNDTEQTKAFEKLMPNTVKVYSEIMDEVMEWAKSGSFVYKN